MLTRCEQKKTKKKNKAESELRKMFVRHRWRDGNEKRKDVLRYGQKRQKGRHRSSKGGIKRCGRHTADRMQFRDGRDAGSRKGSLALVNDEHSLGQSLGDAKKKKKLTRKDGRVRVQEKPAPIKGAQSRKKEYLTYRESMASKREKNFSRVPRIKKEV